MSLYRSIISACTVTNSWPESAPMISAHIADRDLVITRHGLEHRVPLPDEVHAPYTLRIINDGGAYTFVVNQWSFVVEGLL